MNDARASAVPHDDFLVSSALAGDEAALRKLMERYDRLVRFTIFRLTRQECLHDPDWLDTLAADVWTGCIRSLRARFERDDRPQSLSTYLIQASRNRCISALRKRKPPAADQVPERADTDRPAPEPAPDDIAASLEEMSILRECVAELAPERRRMFAHLQAITDRRWQEAAAALGVSESTLRSRWQSVLDDS
ncbi:MAG: sigma-70 family RNA polymerase sigma factor [Planctomycetes bacterium]|nr:sigma-70 family RNA polymerase sigma factor [Planctomycetota bacterium]